ncbi:MAG TPA: hypothetical protein VHQ47_06535 [Phycisphaerae bacterium]|nr:hypothetical protein [Phycisphaerae bacterium]
MATPSPRLALALAILAAALPAFADNIRVTSVDSQLNTTTYSYDANGSAPVPDTSVPNATTYTYDSHTVTTTPDGATTYAYDDLDRTTVTTSPPATSYDQADHDSVTDNATSSTTHYDYDNGPSPDGSSVGNPNLTNDGAAGGTTTYSYDGLNRSTTQTDALGNTTTNRYDDQDGVVHIDGADSHNNTTTYQYDALDRQIQVTDALGDVSSTNAYDTIGEGAIDFIPDSSYRYDALGTIIESNVDATVTMTLYDIDDSSTLFSHTFTYDDLANTNASHAINTSLFPDFTGGLNPNDTYVFTYKYDLLNTTPATTGAGTATFALTMSTPLPRSLPAALLPLAAIPLAAFRRRRKALHSA